MSYPAFQLRPLEIGDLLDETFRLYRRHFLHFAAMGAALFVPLGVLQILLGAVTRGANLVGSLVGLLAGLAGLVVYAAIVYAASEAILGRHLTVGPALVRGYRRFWPLLGLTIVSSFLFALMAITVIGIPLAIYFAVGWVVSFQALLIEGVGIRRALGRSRALVRGRWWPTLAAVFLLGILSGIVLLILSLPSFILSGVAMVLGRSSPAILELAILVLSVLASTIWQVLAAPFYTCGLVLLYHDLRVRKEGFDLEVLAREMEAALP